VNNRKVLNGVMEVAGLAGDDKAEERGIVLRAIDKMDRLGVEGVRALLGAGRKDESGDFAKGAGLGAAQADRVLGFVLAREEAQKSADNEVRLTGIADNEREHAEARDTSSYGRSPTSSDAEAGFRYNRIIYRRLAQLVEGSDVGMDGVEELDDIASLLAAQGYGPDRILIDPGVVRGLGYYTGPVFEAELTFEILDEKGRKRQFGSVAGGGRYDDLVKRFTGQSVPATGVSIGVDRLLAALTAKGLTQTDTAGPIVVTVMDRDRMADYMGMVGDLRAAGIRTEVYLGNPKNFGNQLKYADNRRSPIAIIQGGDEAAKGTVILKDLILGAKIAESATLEEWKGRPAQVEVPRADLVAAVRKMLAE
jgi:histidyl-tRNA synthetase